MSKIKFLFLSAFIMLTLPIVFLKIANTAEGQTNYFKIHKEIKVSSENMDCNYQSEDYGKYQFNFEYPKLITTGDRPPLVAYIDEVSNELIISEVSDTLSKIVFRTPFWGRFAWERWPIIFTRGNNIYLAIYSGYYPAPEKKKIKIFLLNRETGQINIQDEKVFTGDKQCGLWGIYEYHDQFLLIGNCNYICTRYLPTVLLGGNPTYYQNVSFVFTKDGTLTKQSIEELGCHNVFKQEYGIDNNKGMHAVWIREKRELSGKKQDEVYYSENNDGSKWSNPLKLYTLPLEDRTDYDRLNISLVSSGKSTFVLWRDKKKGVFLSEIKKSSQCETITLSDVKDIKTDYSEPMAIASAIKVTSDSSDNVYTLWVNNSGKDYKLFFKSRIDGKWSPEVIINQGSGYLKLPDMKVDRDGSVHITYIKSIKPDKPRDEVGCYYMKLERR